MTPHNAETDVVVIGGGMAGLCAASAAREHKASVMVLEADQVPGGAARWSSGRIWSLPDRDAFRRQIPLGDHTLQYLLADQLSPALEWLGAVAGHLGPLPVGKPRIGRLMLLGQPGDRSAYLAALAEACIRMGVDLRLGVRATRLQRCSDGRHLVSVEPLPQATPQASASSIAPIVARVAVIATGGFQGDRQLRQQHLGPEAGSLMLRSNPLSIGDGLRMGLGLGGALSRGMGGFYGKTMPRYAESAHPSTYKQLTIDVARSAIAINLEGLRFVDETAGQSGESLAAAGMYQPQSRYIVVCDGDQASELPFDALQDLARRVGVADSEILLRADSVDELADKMHTHWGVSPDTFVRTVEEVNAAAASGRGTDLVPPRSAAPNPLRNAPLTAIACMPSITLPYGGLWVDDNLRLLDTNRSPIPGVFVAGADAGGVYVGAYAGGLAWALVSGWMAGRHAAADGERHARTS